MSVHYGIQLSTAQQSWLRTYCTHVYILRSTYVTGGTGIHRIIFPDRIELVSLWEYNSGKRYISKPSLFLNSKTDLACQVWFNVQ